MEKKKIEVGPYLYPMPLVLIGANVGGKANFMPLAWISMVEHEPYIISISSYQTHFTNNGIIENLTFSINIPSESMIEATDYCGLKTGEKIDKSQVFEVFYGELKTAPMIKQAPLNLECRLVNTINTKEFISTESKGHFIFFGEIIQAYADETYLTNGMPDITKMKPFSLTQADRSYWNIGKKIGSAWYIGKDYSM
ncbi:MAG: flavin reductase family protein [Candidatus Lokiarchaeota archaeon]|nr:flavin reductase family protein [Candidatus Lokiarchaeota archaeon]